MFHKGPFAANGASQKWNIFFGGDIFQRNLAHLYTDGHEQKATRAYPLVATGYGAF
jgi:hypothetical protein